MILYHLKCECGHDFDAWFRDSATYDRQEKRGQVGCPACASARVTKAPMAPRLSGDHRKKGARDAEVPAVAGAGDISVPPEMRARAVAREILRTMRKVQKEVEETCENVGENFAEEARAIHYGEAEERGIYGEATLAEAKELFEEDIPVRLLGVKKKNRRKMT